MFSLAKVFWISLPVFHWKSLNWLGFIFSAFLKDLEALACLWLVPTETSTCNLVPGHWTGPGSPLHFKSIFFLVGGYYYYCAGLDMTRHGHVKSEEARHQVWFHVLQQTKIHHFTPYWTHFSSPCLVFWHHKVSCPYGLYYQMPWSLLRLVNSWVNWRKHGLMDQASLVLECWEKLSR